MVTVESRRAESVARGDGAICECCFQETDNWDRDPEGFFCKVCAADCSPPFKCFRDVESEADSGA